MEQTTFKPNRSAFIWYFLIKSLIAAMVSIFGVTLFFGLSTGGFFIVGLVILLNIVGIGFGLVNRYVRYGKEVYIFEANRLIVKSGGIFSDSQRELNIKNITNIRQIYPFIETKLFGTGKLKIESAGSADTEILLESIDNLQEVRERVETLMNNNGFVISRDKLVYETKPSTLGVVIDLISFGIASIFVAIWVIPFIADMLEATRLNIGIIVLMLCGLVLLGIALFAVIRFLDLKQRVYSVYESVIIYNEGFLTKHYDLIPVKNLSDAADSQNLLQRILGISNIKISTRGTGNDFTFSNIPNGHLMEASIDSVIELTMQEAKANYELGTKASTAKSDGAKLVQRGEVKPRNYSEFTAEYKIDVLRAFVGPLVGVLITFIIFVPIALLVMSLSKEVLLGLGIVFIIMLLSIVLPSIITIGIRYIGVKYSIKKNSIHESFDFLQRYTKEFTLDKITAVRMRQDLIDRIFNTCSIDFFSIGSAENITFAYIKKSDGLYQQILDKVGINHARSEVLESYKPSFTIFKWAAANFIGLAIAFVIPFILALFATAIFEFNYLASVLVIGLIMDLVILLGLIYAHFYYRSITFELSNDFICKKGGVFDLFEHYGLQDFIKSITTKKYPLVNSGSLTFDVAGDNFNVQQQQQQSQYGKKRQQAYYNNKIRINYLDNLPARLLEAEAILIYDNSFAKLSAENQNKARQAFETALLETKPLYAQEIILSTVFFVIFFPLIVFLPLVWIHILTKRYFLTEHRICYERGFFFKTLTSVLYKQIDHIEKNQNLFNKMFGTGNVQINTEGSSHVELTIANVKDWQNIYEEVKKKY